MSFHSPAQIRERANADSPISHCFLQRKCDRDQHIIVDGEYADLYSSGQLFNSASIGMFTASRFGHDFSQVKLHADEAVPTLPSRRTPLTVQRFPKNEDEMPAPCPTCPEAESTEASAAAEMASEEAAPAPETEHAPTPATPEPTVEAPTPEETPAPGLILEDSTTELGPGQMRKSEFLAQLRTEVTLAAEAAMAGTGRTTAECPYLDYWFGYYKDKDGQHIERAIRRYAPETSRATTARDYIPMVAARVSRSVELWARTGEITGVPEGMPLGLPGMGLLGGIGRLIPGIGGIFFKAREGGAKSPDDPQAIQKELVGGQPLDSNVRSRMESAFGMDFSHVRTHTDTNAAGLSNRLNARAFTVGEHVAFGSGEYRPGTLIGDALIAHEMAHVVQQSGTNSDVAPLQSENTGHRVLEEDADSSAIGAITSLWGGAKGKLARIAQNAVPCLRSGLSLQRCATTPSRPQTSLPAMPTPASPTQTPAWTETRGGEAGCDTDTGSVIWSVTVPDNQSCLQPCADAHERAHERFMQEECSRVSTSVQRAQQALDTVRRVQTPANMDAAEAAVQEAERATSAYTQWVARTIAENEAQAYRATVEVCGTPEAQQRCRDAGQQEAYRRNMEYWRRCMTTPRNCINIGD